MNPIPISERPRIEEFTIKVFNLYNGRINVFNKPAKLNIEWALRYNSNNGGSARNPSNITIYPEVIRRAVADEYHFWYNLIVCVIHELFHVDQVICYPKLMYDEAYKNIIESAVEMETYLFIANHQYEIAQSTGFDDRIRYDQYYDAIKDKFETGILYQRRDYHSHMVSILQDMLFTEKHPVIDQFNLIFSDMRTNITMRINNLEFMLKIGPEAMPIDQFNNIVDEEFFKFNLRYANVDIQHQPNSMNYVLEVYTQCSYLMGKQYNTF